MQSSDLKVVVNSVLILLKHELLAKNIQVFLLAPYSEYRTMLDPIQIEQVLLNVIKNSIEALLIKPHRVLKIKLHYNAKNKLILDISDNGPRISSHVQEKIFIPFFTTKHSGSGIGLSLSKQIMRNHNGDITYIEQLKKHTTGSCFRFMFS